MSKVLSYEDKLRGDFKKYLVKIAVNKSDHTLVEGEILKAFDLAVQKQKLTTLENELIKSKTSIFDVSRNVTPHSLVDAIDTLNDLAQWTQNPGYYDDGTIDYSEFDEPFAARKARECLKRIDP